VVTQSNHNILRWSSAKRSRIHALAALAWITAALNYAVFAAVLLALPGTYPPVALVISSLSAAIVAYICMRFAVFTS
jgi:putative flippase GtrA